MMDTYEYHNLSNDEIETLCRRPRLDFESILDDIKPITEEVRQNGDEAVLRYTEKFDGVSPDPLLINPFEEEFSLEKPVKEAIDTAYQNIFRFHKAQIPSPIEVETMPGVTCNRVARPIENVGLYVPGGTARLPSSLLMLAIPAAIAGCKHIVVATPPSKKNRLPGELLYIARKTGIRTLVMAGGAQAVAAMAYGTETIPKVDKIAGPGNQYVTAAKMYLQNRAMVSIDMPAGPSEVLVIADESANPDFVAADLLSQAEHGVDSQVILVATPGFAFSALEHSLKKQLENLPRKNVAARAIEHSFLLKTTTIEEAIAFSNRYAPEHLILQCSDPRKYSGDISHAGSVFLGPWSPESMGDYASGTNHTLPTYGYARMYSGLSVESFLKYITMQELTQEGCKALGPAVEKLAEIESLEGHKQAVRIRLDTMN